MFYAIIVADELAGVKSLHIDALLQGIAADDAAELGNDILHMGGCSFQNSVFYIYSVYRKVTTHSVIRSHNGNIGL